MFKTILLLLLSVFISSCQNYKKPVISNSNPVSSATSTATLKADDPLWNSPLGTRMKPDYNFNPGSQGSKDQNIIIEYALKDNIDVKRTSSGLYYLMEREGKGDAPLRSNSVSCHYTGYLLNGTEFNNTYKSGQPLNFNLEEVIPGWTEALLMMKPGGKIKLLIPSGLAFGQAGTPGGPIAPNSVLGFDMELLKVIN
ncbi:MAG: FKBP-type peptidyl-prolyl cis-trans isomerase [Saprospiraceae bacterium]